MNLDDLNELANTIATLKPEVIQRELRALAITRQYRTQQHETRRKILVFALEFLSSQTTALPENWRNSFACYEQLSDWFGGATHLENHKQMSAQCWYLQMAKYIPADLD